MGHLFVGIFDRLARARAIDPALLPESLLATLVDFVAGVASGVRGVPRARRAARRR
jgi:hypothetical protein